MATLKIPVYVPSDLLEELGAHTGHFWSDVALEPIILDAIRAYMQPAPVSQQEPAAKSDEGYQWKQVFLPEGTKLRASFGHQPYFAVVEGAQIKYGAHAISPSCFANLYGSGNRNAWKSVWLRFPGSDEWLLADVCRAARRTIIARMSEGAAPQATQTARPATRLAPAGIQPPGAQGPARGSGDDKIKAHGKPRRHGRGRRGKRRTGKHAPARAG
jgi:hypothetical protein